MTHILTSISKQHIFNHLAELTSLTKFCGMTSLFVVKMPLNPN